MPDVVLMDISMPGTNGIEATQIIHAELPDVRVIGLSMFEERERASAMRRVSAVDCVTNSGPSNAVIAAIRACASPSKATAAREISQQRKAERRPNRAAGTNPSERKRD